MFNYEQVWNYKKKTFRVHKDVEIKLETIRYHDSKDGETIAATFKASWNKMLDKGLKTPSEKM